VVFFIIYIFSTSNDCCHFVLFFHFWIFKVVRKKARRTKKGNLQTSQKNSSPVKANFLLVEAIQNRKAIKTIGFVLGVFIVSWMPSIMVSIHRRKKKWRLYILPQYLANLT